MGNIEANHGCRKNAGFPVHPQRAKSAGMRYLCTGVLGRFVVMSSQSPVGSIGAAAVLAAAFFMLAAPSASAQQEYCRTARGNVGNGYHYEMWIQDGTNGSACLTVSGADAGFKTVWNLSGYGFVARVGLLFDQTRTAEQIGSITSDFALTKSGTGTAWMGIYGWTVDPLKEYYIIEDWIGWRPQYTSKGTISVDGGDYDVFTNMRVQQPSIKGTQTFEQWYSVRKTPRQSGRITISDHFSKWKGLGMETGKLYEAKLKVEGLSGSGTVDFAKGTVVVGPNPNNSVVRPIRTSRGVEVSFGGGAAQGVLSLVSLTGAVIRSVRVDDSESALIASHDLAKGIYSLRFKGDDKPAVSRTLLLR